VLADLQVDEYNSRELCYCAQNTDPHGHLLPNPYAHQWAADGNAHQDVHTHQYRNNYRHSTQHDDQHQYLGAHCNPDEYSYPRSYPVADSHSHSYADSHRHAGTLLLIRAYQRRDNIGRSNANGARKP
jgi:hypothetical protein